MDIDTVLTDDELDYDEEVEDSYVASGDNTPKAKTGKKQTSSIEWFQDLRSQPEISLNASSWEFKDEIKRLQEEERTTSQRLVTSLDEKIRRVVEKRQALTRPTPQTTEAEDEVRPISATLDSTTETARESDSGSSPEEDLDSELKDSSFKILKTSGPQKLNLEFDDNSNPLPTSFGQLFLSRPLLRAVQELGFETPTPIQARAIPVALKGRDLLGSAVTGSGKTAAYLLPVLERLLHRDRRSAAATRVLVLVPTRELAHQIANMMERLGAHTDVTSAVVVGGLSLAVQAATIRSRPDVIISTPGRLIDHLRNTQSFDIDDLEILILDEADRLLELGFAEELREILRFAPKQRQTMLFSATLSSEVNELAHLSLTHPVRVSADPVYDVAQRLVQEFVRVREEKLRKAMLVSLCRGTIKERAILFFESKRDAHEISIIFGLLGFRAAELHGNLTQAKRLEALERFKDGQVDYLLCTDIAARGLDVSGVRWVVNFEIPKDLTTYIHRVGRTARAGMGGRSITLVGEERRAVMRDLLKRTKSMANLQSRKINSTAIGKALNDLAALEPDIVEILEEERVERELRLADMETRKAKNLIDHQDEIVSRPARTWFMSGREKQELKEQNQNIFGRFSGGDDEKGNNEEKEKKHRVEEGSMGILEEKDNASKKKRRSEKMVEKSKDKEAKQLERDQRIQLLMAHRAKAQKRGFRQGDNGKSPKRQRRNEHLDDDGGESKRRAGVKRNSSGSTKFNPSRLVDRRDKRRELDTIKEPRMLKKGFNRLNKSFRSKQRYRRR